MGRSELGRHIMDRVEQGFAVAAMTGFMVLTASLIWISVI
jgi:hypothetical protein